MEVYINDPRPGGTSDGDGHDPSNDSRPAPTGTAALTGPGSLSQLQAASSHQQCSQLGGNKTLESQYAASTNWQPEFVPTMIVNPNSAILSKQVS